MTYTVALTFKTGLAKGQVDFFHFTSKKSAQTFAYVKSNTGKYLVTGPRRNR